MDGHKIDKKIIYIITLFEKKDITIEKNYIYFFYANGDNIENTKYVKVFHLLYHIIYFFFLRLYHIIHNLCIRRE